MKKADDPIKLKADLNKLQEWLNDGGYEKEIAERERKKKEAEDKERLRIKNKKCPSCKSIQKEHVVKRRDNGILGPGYASWIIDEYYVCQNCGTMYKDLDKG